MSWKVAEGRWQGSQAGHHWQVRIGILRSNDFVGSNSHYFSLKFIHIFRNSIDWYIKWQNLYLLDIVSVHTYTHLVEVLLKVSILCLDCIRGEQDTGFRRTVDFVAQDGILHLEKVLWYITFCLLSYLQVEKSEGDVLDNFLRDIFWIKLGSELELQRRFFFHIL